MADDRSPAEGKSAPIIPVGQWKPGADVQATWRKFGWVPPSESRTEFYDEPKGVK